jgi:acetolactate synthase-1/2/3 large subunit
MGSEAADNGAQMRTGGELLLDTLLAEGADLAFCVPGESYLAVLDALYDRQNRFRMIVCRHEGGAANMAEAYGKLTGRPGVCFVTRGPGASHAAIGVHTAQQDSTPMILFVGQAERSHLDRGAFQEVDYRQMFGKFAKWVTQIEDPRRIPELVGRAFHVAVNGRPGPVVVALPEDVLKETTSAAPPAPFKRVIAAPSTVALEQIRAMLEAAERPLLVLGGGGWDAQAVGRMQRFAEAFALPAAAGFRCQDLFDNTHPHYVGDLGLGVDASLVALVLQADLLLVVGERMGEATTTGYSFVEIPRPAQKLIHVHPDPDELGIVYQAELLVAATMRDFAEAVQDMSLARRGDRTAWIAAGREAYLKKIAPREAKLAIDMPRVVQHLRENLPADAIIANGAGTYTGYVHRFYQYRRFRSQLAPVSGSMGYGFPAAIAAKIVHPERPVVCFAGDGCFLMAAQELATAMRYRLAVVVVLVNNGSYGSIRMHQEREYPGRPVATDLENPDFVALARSYGAYGEQVERTEDFPAAYQRAASCGGPALLELKIGIEDMLAANPRA